MTFTPVFKVSTSNSPLDYQVAEELADKVEREKAKFGIDKFFEEYAIDRVNYMGIYNPARRERIKSDLMAFITQVVDRIIQSFVACDEFDQRDFSCGKSRRHCLFVEDLKLEEKVKILLFELMPEADKKTTSHKASRIVAAMWHYSGHCDMNKTFV